MKNYLIVLRLQEAPETHTDRIRHVADALAKISQAQPSMAFSAPGSFALSGILIQTDQSQSTVCKLLQGETDLTDTAPLLNSDSFLILEVCGDATSLGLDPAVRWLRLHRLTPVE